MFVIDDDNAAKDTTTNTQHKLITKEKERQYYTENLNRMCRMLFYDCGCWHVCLELVSANPFLNYQQYPQLSPCMNNCPHCDHTFLQYVKKVSKNGLQCFLASTLMSTHKKNIYSTNDSKRIT